MFTYLGVIIAIFCPPEQITVFAVSPLGLLLGITVTKGNTNTL